MGPHQQSQPRCWKFQKILSDAVKFLPTKIEADEVSFVSSIICPRNLEFNTENTNSLQNPDPFSWLYLLQFRFLVIKYFY